MTIPFHLYNTNAIYSDEISSLLEDTVSEKSNIDQQNKMKFILYIQKPNPKKLSHGTLTVGKDGHAIFFEDNAGLNDKAIAKMQRVRIEFANSEGIMISGMQPDGVDKRGIEKFKYQEWWLVYEPL